MRPPSRTRRILKWTGAGLTLLIVFVWTASLFWWVVISEYYYISVSFGRLQVGRYACSRQEYEKMEHYESDGRTRAQPGYSIRGGKSTEPLARNLSSSFRRPYFSTQYWQDRRPFIFHIGVPLGFAALLIALPTAWLWHRDRPSQRIPRGHCMKCGYDLTGNTSGACSECGEKCAIAPNTSPTASARLPLP